MPKPEIAIAGAGIIGLSLALELHRRGASVTVADAGKPGIASTAAAGMLAANDPENPLALRDLSRHSLTLYPAFLARVEEASGLSIPIQTHYTRQHAHDGSSSLLNEDSLNPRHLHAALLQAVQNKNIAIQANTVDTEKTVDCTGAWSRPFIQPAKGQILRIRLQPGELHDSDLGNFVIRTPRLYIVPRLDGTALIGATVEDAGFSTSTDEEELQRLRRSASEILPSIADAPQVEAWAGLRPRSADGLPILGSLAPNRFIATGHFRNGILLAPATAETMADLILDHSPQIGLQAFSPARFLA
jgi:glycine oxidase